MQSFSRLLIYSINDIEVYLTGSDTWAIKRVAYEVDAHTLQAKQTAGWSWLPLLEQDYLVFQEQALKALQHSMPHRATETWATFPVKDLVLFGLTASAYWIEQALRWAPYVKQDEKIAKQLRCLMSATNLSQRVRHQAKRILFADIST